MSVHLSLVGDYVLSPELEAKVQASFGTPEEFEPDSAEFNFCNSLVGVAGFYHLSTDLEVDIPGGTIPRRTAVTYRINDDTRSVEAISAIVLSVVGCLAVISGDVALIFPDSPVLTRVGGKLTLYRRYPNNDMWDNPAHRNLVPQPYEVVTDLLPQPGEDDLEDDADEDDEDA